MPGPENNSNAMLHGARARRDLVLVGLAKRWPDVAADCRRYGRLLERLVAERHGALPHGAVERIVEAVRWEAVARACMRVASSPDVSDVQAVDYLFKAGQATQIRRGCVEKLDIDGADTSPADPLAAMLAPQRPGASDEETHVEHVERPSAGSTENDGGHCDE